MTDLKTILFNRRPRSVEGLPGVFVRPLSALETRVIESSCKNLDPEKREYQVVNFMIAYGTIDANGVRVISDAEIDRLEHSMSANTYTKLATAVSEACEAITVADAKK